jgi:hypothetical protein
VIGSLSSTRAALIDRLDGLDEKDRQIVHGARTATAAMKATMGADFLAIMPQIRLDQVAPLLVDRFHQLRQMHLNAAYLALGGTGRTTGRPLDTTAANVSADFLHVFSAFGFSQHG